MESISRNVNDISTDERRVYEKVLGQQLRENQQVIIQVVNLAEEPAEEPTAPGTLPDWCNVYAGLNDAQIAEIEEVVLTRCDLSRPS